MREFPRRRPRADRRGGRARGRDGDRGGAAPAQLPRLGRRAAPARRSAGRLIADDAGARVCTSARCRRSSAWRASSWSSPTRPRTARPSAAVVARGRARSSCSTDADSRRREAQLAAATLKRLRARSSGPRGSSPTGLRRQRRPPTSSRPSATSSSATSASWPSSQSSASSDVLHAGAGRALAAVAGAVRHALRARADAAPDDRARLAAGALSLGAGRSGTNGKSSTARMIAALLQRARRRAPAPTCRRTCAPSPSGSRSEGRPVDASASRAAVGRAPRGRRRWSTARSSRRRPRDAVRGADRRGLLGARARGCRGGGDRGRARRPLRRHQRDRAARAGADQRRPRAHALARPDRAPHRRGEARGRAPGVGRSSRAGSATRPPRSPTRRRRARRAARALGRRCNSRDERRRDSTVETPAGRFDGIRLAPLGTFQRANFALAVAAAEALLAGMGRGSLDAEGVRRAAAGLVLPGRMEVDRRATRW